MAENEEILARKTIIVLFIISLAILIIGIILIALGYNEAFYWENVLVQAFFLFITEAGTPIFYIVLVGIFYFALDKKFGKRLSFIVIISSFVNITIKEIIQDPRPSTNESRASERGYAEDGYGFPSGHTQVTLTTWGYTANEYKDKAEPSFLIPILISGFIFLIAISRIIIGVHDLQDIVGGALIGIGFLLVYLYLEPFVSKKIEPLGIITKIIFSSIVPIIILIINLTVYPILYFSMLSGMLLGLSTGFVLEEKYVQYDTDALNGKQKSINLVFGLIILLIPFLTMELLLPDIIFVEFLKYALLAFILSYVIPLIFTKINRNHFF